MINYFKNVCDSYSLPRAVSYITKAAHDWWIVFKESDEGRKVQTWKELRNALVSRFETLNKENIARDMLPR